ncbi:MAG: sulfatase [Pseudomonadales bacterium]
MKCNMLFKMLIVISMLFQVSAICADDMSSPIKNVLFIVMDDLRPELQTYGKLHIQSPEIDALANESVLFSNAYSNVPVCGASRASVLSGLRPSPHRFLGYQSRIDEDAPEAITLPAQLKNSGFRTISVGKVLHFRADSRDDWSKRPWHPMDDVKGTSKDTGHRDYQIEDNILRFKKERKGPAFEAADVPDNDYFDGKIAERAIAELQKAAEEEQPFFLAVGFLKPHLPFNAPKKYWDLYAPDSIALAKHRTFPTSAPQQAWHDWGELRKHDDVPPAPELMPDDVARDLVRGYAAAVSYSDAQVGKVLKALESQGLAENTLVILWGDHGWSLGEHGLWAKHSPFDVATKVPLLIRAPGLSSDGGRADGLAELVDLYPTIVDLLQLPQPDHLQGRSLRPQLLDPAHTGKEAVFMRWRNADIVRTDRFSYTQWKNKAGEQTAHMLYDLNADPEEVINIADDSAFEDQVKALKERLHVQNSWYPKSEPSN